MADPRRSPAAKARPVGADVLIALLLLLSANALFGGYRLLADPSGGRLGLPVSLLEGSPFADYAVPGVILVAVLGLFPLLAVWGLWFRPTVPALRGLEHLTHEHWAWAAAVTVGCALVVWILVQMTLLRFWLQPVLLVLGLLILGISLLPSVRRFYASPLSLAGEGKK